jgi:hypothetical protein
MDTWAVARGLSGTAERIEAANLILLYEANHGDQSWIDAYPRISQAYI